MRPRRSLPVLLSLALGLAALGAPRIALATSYSCGSVPYRILAADAIILGHTISTQGSGGRPGHFTTTYNFQIEEVLKGRQFRAGEVITETGSTASRFAGTHFPPPNSGPFVFFMRMGRDGILHSGPCSIRMKRDDIAAIRRAFEEGTVSEEFLNNLVESRPELSEIRRMVKVATAPQDFLDSTDKTDEELVYTWIAQNYFSRSNRRMEKDTSEAELPIDRDTVLEYLARRVRDETRTHSRRAVAYLGRFCEEEHYELLKSVHDAGRGGAYQGLLCIEARMEVPPLINKLRRLRLARREALSQPLSGDGPPAVWPDQEYATVVVELIDVLHGSNNPDMAIGFIRELEGDGSASPGLGGRLGDETALVPILRLAAVFVDRAKELAGIFDPDAVRKAREALYDDPKAVVLLAQKGDDREADFMVRLIHQGHGAGARWAATVQDPSLIPDLLEALLHANAYNAGSMAYALGRMRAWQVMDLLEDADGHRHYSKQSMFILGLLNESQFWARRTPRSHASKRLREFAEAEHWPDDVYEIVARLATEVETGSIPGRRMPEGCNDSSIPWVPPARLPDMPDPVSNRQVRQFLQQNRERAATVLRWGSAADKCKVLRAASQAEVEIDPDVVVTLLMDGSFYIRNLASRCLYGMGIELTKEQIRRWALDGSYEVTTHALGYITRKANKAHAPIVEEVFRREWHLFDAQMFRAIIATDARGCADQLRGYLDEQHIFLRHWAAVTLAHFGDDSGRDALGKSGQFHGRPKREELSRAWSLIDP